MSILRARHAVVSVFVAAGSLWLGVQLAAPHTSAAAFVDTKAAGAEVYATSGCAHCHGADGQGGEKGPNLHNLRKKMPADKVHDQIVNGGNGMPPFGDALTPDQVANLVEFLRAKKWMTPPPPHEAASPATGSPAQR